MRYWLGVVSLADDGLGLGGLQEVLDAATASIEATGGRVRSVGLAGLGNLAILVCVAYETLA